MNPTNFFHVVGYMMFLAILFRMASHCLVYNRHTGKITIVVENHRDIEDIEQTVLHEAVAHHGLRQLRVDGGRAWTLSQYHGRGC